MKPLMAKPPEVVTGGSIGSLLIYLAGWIPDPTYHQLALYLTPFAAFALTKVFFWLSQFGGREARIYLRERDLKRGRMHLETIMKDPTSSPQLIQSAKTKVESLNLVILALKMEEIVDPTKRKGA